MILRVQIADALDDYRRAKTLVREAITIDPVAPADIGRYPALDLYAALLAKQGQSVLAARLLGALELMRPRLRNLMHPTDLLRYEHMVADLRQTLGEAAFADAWREGMGMTMEETISSLGMPANGVAETEA
jgi:hypothetical protein